VKWVELAQDHVHCQALMLVLLSEIIYWCFRSCSASDE